LVARRPTIIDVARLAGVSKATVARVISGEQDLVRPETRERVLEAATQLGYERNAIAGSLRTNQTNMIVLSIPDITNPFWPAVARGVQDTLEGYGFATMTVNSDWSRDREQRYLQLVRRNRFDGLIINPASVSNDDLKDLRIPVVTLGGGENHPDFDSVGSDTEHAVQDGLSYLLELGHHRIGLIAGLSRRRKAQTRYQSYITFHARHFLHLDDRLVVETEFSDQAGYEAMTYLLGLDEPPTAVLAANDIIAIGALKAAHASGYIVPDDVSIIGMDDIDAAVVTSPPLTTIAKPKYDIGVKAAEMLIESLRGLRRSEPQHIILPCRLVKRGTTAPPPSSQPS
jgi:DNA-binding LacI/PurR family transcriptional regulator